MNLHFFFIGHVISSPTAVPKDSPENVNAKNYTSINSLLVTWDSIPSASRNGVILGYKVFYRPVLVSREQPTVTSSFMVIVGASDQQALLTKLDSFTVYEIEVLGFNVVGDGLRSTPIYAAQKKVDSSKNPEEFPKSFLQGTPEGIWWTFITMTTVGYGDKTPRSPLGRIFAVASTLIGLVTTAVLIGCLTSSLTTDIVFTDVRLFGAKIAAVHNSSEFRLGLKKNAKMNPDREYKNLDDLHEALRSREVEGALVDALVAGSRGDLFNSSELRIYKTLHHSSVYGVVLAGHAKKLQKCFSNFLKENSAEVSAHVASKTKVIKTECMPREGFEVPIIC
ncbi:hypothetical protein pdam_00005270 [Pocillopora damicornis]|uniref:Fibronectin type-III domain-containing protein n=1 Tax=Pocillopora damicornis TaxID=46731 RepID=A0A3M6TSB3_POCDA|nr:hypothetical protein pdam_00005270 [Pocillopora damicornis]